MTKWKNKSKEGWTRVIDGTRENMTDHEMIANVGQKKFDAMLAEDAAEKAAGPIVVPRTHGRTEIQARAKELKIDARQTNDVLLELIAEAEGTETVPA